jgi:hypothetical protein
VKSLSKPVGRTAGLFAALGLIMLGIILVAEPDPQYDLSEIMGPDEDAADQSEQQGASLN